MLIGKHVWKCQVKRVPPDATEPSTGFSDGVVVLSPDTQSQAVAPSFSPGSKVTLTGATSKGVLAQGTVYQAKENGAEVFFVTHPQPSSTFQLLCWQFWRSVLRDRQCRN